MDSMDVFFTDDSGTQYPPDFQLCSPHLTRKKRGNHPVELVREILLLDVDFDNHDVGEKRNEDRAYYFADKIREKLEALSELPLNDADMEEIAALEEDFCISVKHIATKVREAIKRIEFARSTRKNPETKRLRIA